MNSVWTVNLSTRFNPDRKYAAIRAIRALNLAGERLSRAGSGGEIRLLSAANGKFLGRQSVPEPLWDGMAIARKRVYLSTAGGELFCLGEK